MLRPLGDWILLEVDPRPTQVGSIILPADTTADVVFTGTVKAVGPGKKIGHHRRPVGIEAGEKIAFLRWHLEHKSGKQIGSFLEGFGDKLALIRADDVLFAYSAKESVVIQ